MSRRVVLAVSTTEQAAVALAFTRATDEAAWAATARGTVSLLRQLIRPDRSPRNVTERRHLRFCIAVSAALFLASSIFSVGPHNPDEYFQTVEFASSKLSITRTTDLPWEYREQMRPWLQPAIYTGIAQAAEYVGVKRPLALLLLFRLTTAFLACASLWALVVAGRHWIAGEIDRRRLYSIAAFLWLLPFLGARTSSESLATSALCFGIALLEWRATLPDRGVRLGLAVLAGLALGLCFEFRCTSGIMALGAVAWYLRPAGGRLALCGALALGAFAALALGALADWWGYGHIAFPAFSYIYQNFVVGRASRDFGAAPFFAYLYLPLLEAGVTAPLVFTLIVCTLTAWLARPLNVLTWATLPYVVLLCATAHKETRFLFPLIPFLPFFVIFALNGAAATGARLNSFVRWLITAWRLKVAYALNFCGLVGVVLMAQAANFPLYELMENFSYRARVPVDAVVVHALGKMPYGTGEGHMAFIEPKNVRWTANPSLDQLQARESRGEAFLAFLSVPLPRAESAAWIGSRCSFVWSTWPQWLQPYDYLGWEERSAWWMLYRCDSRDGSIAANPGLHDARQGSIEPASRSE